MNKTIKRVSVTQTTETTTQAVAVTMSPQELDAIGRLVLTEEQGGIFTPSHDLDILGFHRRMDVVARENGRVVLVPARRAPSRAREIGKSAHGKVSLMECGDVVVNFRFSHSLRGRMARLMEEECLSELAADLRTWECKAFLGEGAGSCTRQGAISITMGLQTHGLTARQICTPIWGATTAAR